MSKRGTLFLLTLIAACLCWVAVDTVRDEGWLAAARIEAVSVVIAAGVVWVARRL